jgi:hypothetical protein
VGKARDERDADIAARACEPRQNLDIRKTEDDARAELQRAMNEAAAEINRRIPIPEGP